jgi:heme/copper-type cytochrome/quinol oxidase subunit 2
MSDIYNDQLKDIGLQLDNDARQHLFEAGKWAKFIAIVVFAGCALFLLAAMLSGTKLASAFQMGSFGQDSLLIIILIVLFIIAIVGAVFYFLFNFSRKIKKGLIEENTESLNSGLRSLKVYFIITSIFAILSLLSTLYSAFTG